jgi:hypothetical protein
MADEWLSNEGASQRVIALLNDSGIPHELRVAALCRAFCASYSGDRRPHARTQKLVYSTDSMGEYREIDQFVELYEEFNVDELTAIDLSFNIPVECKHRSDVEYFAFPLPMVRPHPFPVASMLSGSDYFRSLAPTYRILRSIPLADLRLVQIKDGRTPKIIHKENVIYNAAAALYDFVLFEVQHYGPSMSNHSMLDDPLLQELFERFQAYLDQFHYAWWMVLREWMKENVSCRAEDFNKRYFGGERDPGGHQVHYGVEIYLPIVCISGDLFEVHTGELLEITGFAKINACIATIRKHSWPGNARFALLAQGADVPVVVTNLAGLTGVLDIAVTWFRDMQAILKSANPSVKAWPVEALFFQKVIHYFAAAEPEEGYRSDSDQVSQRLLGFL